MGDPVLIAGAGPTGLVLALSLVRRGVPVRLIDAASGPGQHSRAMAVQARTLELYAQLGIADDVVAQGVRVPAVRMREGGRSGAHDVMTVPFRDLGGGLSPFPFALAYPQDDHEKFLAGVLERLGCSVEWNTSLVDVNQSSDVVRARIARDGATETVETPFVCGCDGAHSRVRESLGLGFPGGTYEQLFYVADVAIDREFDPRLTFTLGARILTLMLPVRSRGMQRLIGLVPPELSARTDLTFEDIRAEVERLLDVRVTTVNWFSTYRVHHRVAAKFRVGRVFLAGDAGHIHSPAGGQGMNTGIGDAVNLGWKIAQALRRGAGDELLESYDVERVAFARSLVASTDRGFTLVVRRGIAGELVRRVLVPLVFGVATRFEIVRHAAFRVVSQTRVAYPQSALSEGRAGRVRGGDRLPWLAGDGLQNFAPLTSLDWQMHVYGSPSDQLARACDELYLPLHAFAWDAAARKAGFARDAAYLVRPDGYVALAADADPAQRLRDYTSRHRLRYRDAPPA